MKKIAFTLLIILFALGCRNAKQTPKMMPVESDGGIGDGAPPLDSLLQYQTPPIIEQDPKNKPTDSLK